MSLPILFFERMQQQLGGQAAAFFSCYDRPALRGLRLNPLKCSKEILAAALPFPLEPAPFSPFSYYAPESFRPGREPLHHAGAFYMQEPSAAAAVTALRPQPGERILDLCAAPGGKSTQIAGLLAGKGLLWSNELVRSRAKILLSNMERLGVRNAVVSSCAPEVLCTALAGFFDRVLVDAPCSGEGMFRRDETAVQEWSPEHVDACAVRQQAILESARQAVRPGGVLTYSTCTFSPQENEGVVTEFLKRHADFTLADCGLQGGRPALEKARRIYPMDGGEGHFVAVMRRDGDAPRLPAAGRFSESLAAKELLGQLFAALPEGIPTQFGDKLYLLPQGLPPLQGLGVLRAGVLLGEEKPVHRKGALPRLEPAHAAFLAAEPRQLLQCVALEREDARVQAFLHGEEIEVPQEYRGYCGVSVSGVTVGFGKAGGGRFKNHYPKGLRMLG
ncbi:MULTISPECIES: RsmB/NOP family class I SAM-dependent RNA methyltransferase [Caproicibacterium]|uniref:RsmF rRNA methyltransferase first C-terminal domain-containing protein n=1 Tax=Caproicibacterium argilliputei TaxID=3030016 RepID=A0AA97DBQ4_9FIRM|nr:RsmF rRNA methyltransferase first C-terminal domain-containing protein [Caproicibacterium argilliputei]WOC33327.1 RsmF rRNA methyltransferase first C-terminal domain-containing protein [Caproicibacterium argilliputei]